MYFLTACILVSCSTIDTDSSRGTHSTDAIVDNSNVEVRFEYDSLTIPNFLNKLVFNHIDGYKFNDTEFNKFCVSNGIDSKDSSNVYNYYSFEILHDLFTSQSATNCSIGKILVVPYYWHWVTPNPRHEIRFVENDSLLIEISPPNKFSKYTSFADIDRTPYLYLSDLFSEKPKYYSECDTFSTFGWCSEREMSFVCLNQIFGLEGKVVTQDNHSWSEFMIPMSTLDNSFKRVLLSVDNTFNHATWGIISDPEYGEWKLNFGNDKLSKWYNKKAHSMDEANKIKRYLVSNNRMNLIDDKLTDFINAKNKK